jgi:hypothetical protein
MVRGGRPEVAGAGRHQWGIISVLPVVVRDRPPRVAAGQRRGSIRRRWAFGGTYRACGRRARNQKVAGSNPAPLLAKGQTPGPFVCSGSGAEAARGLDMASFCCLPCVPRTRLVAQEPSLAASAQQISNIAESVGCAGVKVIALVALERGGPSRSEVIRTREVV